MSSVLALPSQSVPLGRVVERRKDAGRPDLPALSVYLETGVVPRSTRDDNHNRLGADLSNYLVVEPGDLVVNKLRTWQGGLGVSAHRGIVSPAYFVCRPLRGFEPRFLHYVLRSAPYLAEFTRISKFMPPSQFDITWDDLKLVPVPKLRVQKQLAIADFLDTETARIDALVTKKRRMIDLLGDRLAARRERLFVEHGEAAVTPLMHLTDQHRPIVYGIVQAGDHVPDGVPYIKTGDMAQFDPGRLERTSTEIEAQYRRARVSPGDLVIAMRASIGTLIEIPADLPVANLTQGTARIAAAPGVSNRWLRHVLRTSFVQEQFQVRAVGSTFRTLNIWDLRRVGVPAVPPRGQEALADEMDDLERVSALSCRALQAQVLLLSEHRQALVTAAVTGELAIPEVAA